MSSDQNNQASPLTGGRQTMAAWSKVIETYEAVPEIYKSFFKAQFTDGQPFPYTILTPPLERFLRRTSEKLVCDLKDSIHIMERSGNKVVTKSYPYSTIRAVEVGNILLNSWITINGLTSEGVAGSSTIEFSAATGERYFSVFLNKMRPAPEGDDDTGLNIEKDKFNYLSVVNFKFMSYGRNCLIRGENVIRTIFQPEIREIAGTWFGWTLYRTISPAHLVILTNKELILIQDDERAKDIRGARYGGVWHYIPLRSIVSVSLTESVNEMLTLAITISPDEIRQQIFDVHYKSELEQLRDKIKGLTG